MDYGRLKGVIDCANIGLGGLANGLRASAHIAPGRSAAAENGKTRHGRAKGYKRLFFLLWCLEIRNLPKFLKPHFFIQFVRRLRKILTGKNLRDFGSSEIFQ